MSDDGDKLTSIDFLLKEKLVDLWFAAVNFSINGEFVKCFNAYKAMFRMIEGYNFSCKSVLSELTAVIGNYLDSLGGKPLSSRAIVSFNKRSLEFKELLDVYMSELPKAFIDLDLWFKTVPVNSDLDLRFSEENFNSELSIVGVKRSELKKLVIARLVDLMSNNVVNDVYARWRVENVL